MKAIDVANFFITLCSHNPENDLTNLKLNKLVYYAQAWYLVKTGKPLFPEQIEAWDFGPVVNSVYSSFESVGSYEILRDTYGSFSEEDIPDDALDILMDVYFNYGKYAASYLVTLTHVKGGPWDAVYKDGEKHIPIPNDSIKEYFEAHMDEFDTLDIDSSKIPTAGYVDEDKVTVVPREIYGE